MAVKKEDLEKSWRTKIEQSESLFKRWLEKYRPDLLEKYYEGFQYANMEDGPYVFNLFYSTIETKMPILIFDNPKFTIEPRPKSVFTDPDAAFQIAVNLEDAINDFATDAKNLFQEEMEGAVHDGWFYFGIAECGYSANWVDNPNVPKPFHDSDFNRNIDSSKVKKDKSGKIPANERAYIKHIPAENFRISAENSKYLHRADWVGYWDWYRLKDLKSNTELDLSGIPEVGINQLESGEIRTSETDENKRMRALDDYVKVWKIWSRRDKMKYYFIEDYGKLIFQVPYRIFPFEDFRFRKPKKGFYPLPVTFNWVSPQNEANEVREANKMHRRRFKRVYTLLSGAADFDEVQKLITGPDGTVIEINRADGIRPIENANLGSSNDQSLVTSKNDFDIESGTTAEQRGEEADRVTATQANISNQRASIRESREKVVVANFECRVARKLLKIMQMEFVNPIVVADKPQEQFLGDISNVRTARSIDPLTDLGDEDYEYNINISIESTSPVANEEEKRNFLEFISLLNQFPQFSISPILVRELAFRTGYRNERVIQEFQKMAQLQLLGIINQGVQGLAAQGIDGSQIAQNIIASQTPPDAEEVRQQINPSQVLQ